MAAKPEPRIITVAAAQLGPNQKAASRQSILDRMLKLMDEAASKGVKIIAYPELALTTFFPVHYMTDKDEIANYFETTSPSEPYAVLESPHAKPLVERANALGIDFYLGFAERWTGADGKTKDFNTCIYYSAVAREGVGKYRKVHLPGRTEPLPDPKAFQQLEKKYFTPGDLGFKAFRAPGLVKDALKAEDVEAGVESVGKGDPILGMLICNDRRWPEAWRPYGLQVRHPKHSIIGHSRPLPPLSNILSYNTKCLRSPRVRSSSLKATILPHGRRNTKELQRRSRSSPNSTTGSRVRLEVTKMRFGVSTSQSVVLRTARVSLDAVPSLTLTGG